MPKQLISLAVNGRPTEVPVEPRWTLLEMVREELRLSGSKEGCGTGDCGACSMILRGAQDE
ncbi:MAG: 2Fe-2S iron-sulfur cluster binding domain-containing protein, partial [Chloroflexi bacterium]